MAELKCAVQNCSYNANERCSKGDIMVGGKHASCSAETCCESFTEKKGDSFKSAVEHPSEYISIDCEAAKCMYNENYKCTASRVDIRAAEHVIARKRHVQHLTESKKNSEGGLNRPGVSVAMHMSEHNNDRTFR